MKVDIVETKAYKHTPSPVSPSKIVKSVEGIRMCNTNEAFFRQAQTRSSGSLCCSRLFSPHSAGWKMFPSYFYFMLLSRI